MSFSYFPLLLRLLYAIVDILKEKLVVRTMVNGRIQCWRWYIKLCLVVFLVVLMWLKLAWSLVNSERKSIIPLILFIAGTMVLAATRNGTKIDRVWDFKIKRHSRGPKGECNPQYRCMPFGCMLLGKRIGTRLCLRQWLVNSFLCSTILHTT